MAVKKSLGVDWEQLQDVHLRASEHGGVSLARVTTGTGKAVNF